MATQSKTSTPKRARTAAKKTRKPAAKKAATKKVATKKAATKKAAARKAAPRKTMAGKVAAKKAAPRKAPAKKASAKKTVARKAPPRKAAPKTAAVKKAPAPRKAARKAPAAAPRAGRAAPRAVGRSLGAPAGAAPPAASMPADFFGAYTGEKITDQDFADAAQALGCEVAAIKAVAEVESKGAGFDSSNRPTILYERHLFARHTVPPGKFNATHPDLSATKGYGPGGYGSMSQQYPKLARAYQLDANAALKAPSWGKFQILGENHVACGFATAADYVKAMTISEREHLKAFCKFVAANPAMLQALRAKDWAGFARRYNGPAYAQFKYDAKMAAAYAKHRG